MILNHLIHSYRDFLIRNLPTQLHKPSGLFSRKVMQLATKQYGYRFFHNSIPQRDSKSFVALKELEQKLNKQQATVCNLNFVYSRLIHPSFYSLSPYLTPNLATETQKKIKNTEYQLKRAFFAGLPKDKKELFEKFVNKETLEKLFTKEGCKRVIEEGLLEYFISEESLLCFSRKDELAKKSENITVDTFAQIEKNVFTLFRKPGAFYALTTQSEEKDLLAEANNEAIAKAHFLLALPIFARNKKEILAIIKQYCSLLGFSSVIDMVEKIPDGIVIYVANNHAREYEEIRTLEYITQSNQEIAEMELDYEDLYELFVKPKLFTPTGALIQPEDFHIYALTGSYSNRIFDQLMGRIYQELNALQCDPIPYLAQCYGLHLIANGSV